jgi:hypothetical protein
MEEKNKIFTDEHLELTKAHHHVSLRKREIFEKNYREA